MPRAKTPRGTTRKSAANPVAKSTAANGNGSTLKPGSLEEQIRRRAYEIYEERGCVSGQEGEDWLRAEQEVVARYQTEAGA